MKSKAVFFSVAPAVENTQGGKSPLVEKIRGFQVPLAFHKRLDLTDKGAYLFA